MDSLLTVSNITFALGIVAILFTVYRYFKEPQVASEKQDALLEQQVRFMIENNDRRFRDIQESFNGLLKQSHNHINTIDTKVESLTTVVGTMSNKITQLATIIEERIPNKVREPRSGV